MAFAIRRKQSGKDGDLWLSWLEPNHLGFQHGLSKLASFNERDDAIEAALPYVDQYFGQDGFFELLEWDGGDEISTGTARIEKLDVTQLG